VIGHVFHVSVYGAKRMKRILYLLVGLATLVVPLQAYAQGTLLFEFAWFEGEGDVSIPAEHLIHFGRADGRIEIDWTPTTIPLAMGPGQDLFDVPGRLGVWMYNNGVHGRWFDGGSQRLYRTRWGLTNEGVQSNIVITWDGDGYAVIVDGHVRIHDWQTTVVAASPASGVYGNDVGGGSSPLGSFTLRMYDEPLAYDGCAVDVVGTINESVPADNSGSWSQGIDPACAEPPPPEPPSDFGGSAPLSWTMPTENDDDPPTPLTDLAGVKIYQGDVSGGPYPIEYDAGNVTSYLVENLADGTYYFVAKAYNTQGAHSVNSNEAIKVVLVDPASAPNAPINLVVDDVVVYSVIKVDNGFRLVAVGTVPADTPCDPENSVNGHFAVPTVLVTYFNPSTKPQVVVASCS